MQAQKRLSKPKRRLRTGISLYQRHKLPVKAKRRDALEQKVLPRKKLQQGTGANTARKPRVNRSVFQHQIAVKRTGCGIAVNIAPAPHIRKSVAVKKVPVCLHQRIGVLLKLRRKIRLLLIPIPHVPKRRIHVKCPAGIIIKRMPVTIPPGTGIIIQNMRGVLPHNALVNLIAFHR